MNAHIVQNLSPSYIVDKKMIMPCTGLTHNVNEELIKNPS